MAESQDIIAVRGVVDEGAEADDRPRFTPALAVLAASSVVQYPPSVSLVTTGYACWGYP